MPPDPHSMLGSQATLDSKDGHFQDEKCRAPTFSKFLYPPLYPIKHEWYQDVKWIMWRSVVKFFFRKSIYFTEIKLHL